MIARSIEALCAVFTDGGVECVTNFPGFYSHDIFSALGGKDISINERVAFEMAYGASLAGRRSLVTMKNVGLSATADPFLHSVISGVNGGLVVVVTDDIEVTGSQERHDSRHYYDFFGGLWFEPHSVQSAYAIARESFSLSEKLDTPVVIRLTNQFFDQEGAYEKLPAHTHTKREVAHDPKKFIVYPHYWRKQYDNLTQKNARIAQFVETFTETQPSSVDGSKNGAIMIGSCWRECGDEKYAAWDKLHIETYPLPKERIRSFAKHKSEISVLEQGDPVAYTLIRGIIQDKSLPPQITSDTGHGGPPETQWTIWNTVPKLFAALKSIKPSFVVGDVGQFTVETTYTIDSCLCFGSAVGTTIGLSMSRVDYPFCVVGDTSFLHSETQAMIEARARGIAMGVIIIDNGGAKSTGGQKTICDAYNTIDGTVKMTAVNYPDMKEEQLADILLHMRENQELAVLYVKI